MRVKQVRLVALYLFVMAAVAFSGWFLYSNFEKVSEREQWVAHTGEVINTLDLVLSSVKDAETGIRGFLLTNQTTYLEPYTRGTTEALEHLANFKRLTKDNPEQQIIGDQLGRVIESRFKVLAEAKDEFVRKKGVWGRNDQVSEGKIIMDNLRAQIDRAKAVEKRLLEQRAVEASQSRSFFFWVLIATIALGMMVVSAVFRLVDLNQTRLELEALERDRENYQKDSLAQVAQIMARDLPLETISWNLLEFLSERFGILASKLLYLDGGKIYVAANYGAQSEGDGQLPARQDDLVSAAMHRRDPWQVSEVPKNYWRVSSSMGSAMPTALTFIPFRFQGRELGVIELATFTPLSQEVIRILGTCIETIGVGVSTAMSRATMQELLEKSMRQAEELQTQQEELRTNNEELEQQARALESQQQALNFKNKELEVAKGSLETKADDLEKASQYKSDFLAKMSHELRTPLNGLLILSTLLIENKEKNLTEQQRQFARSINSAGNDLLSLINDILDLSKIEARKLKLRPESFTIGSLFDSKHRTFDPQVAAKNLAFNSDISEEMRATKLFTDRQRLEQILRNFISNAIKFTEEGSITLDASLGMDKKFVTITVTDTGIGIPAEKQQLIFDAFEQADGSVSRKYGGTGLGLTISRELAALLGGDVALESQEGKGSRFSLRIPVHLPESAQQQDAPAPATTEAAPSLVTAPAAPKTPETIDRIHSQVKSALQNIDSKKRSILVVEDDEKFRKSVVEAVQSYGFDAIEAGDGEVALAILNEVAPDAILLDIKLPGISGLGILEMLKQKPHLRPIPVHMISALEYQRNALRMGALGYLTKPVTMEKVRSAISRIENMLSKKLRRVLLIEDDSRQSDAVSKLIEGEEVEVIAAKTGRSAVERLKSEAFDCIILDLTLPDVSGFDLLAELSSLEISVPPVVIYTGKDLTEAEEEYLRRYSESIIIKGARSPERLLDEVNLFLHRVESLLPKEKQEMLTHLRSKDSAFDGKTVLVVDDDIRNIFALTSALESNGLKVRVARNGIEALESLADHRDIDLVLMDIMMPKMDGLEAMRRIRKSQDLKVKAIPIVALTAKAMKEDHERCMDAGASDYLPKPINLDSLITVLKVWLTSKNILT